MFGELDIEPPEDEFSARDAAPLLHAVANRPQEAGNGLQSRSRPDRERWKSR
jgi:hypothetical protein